MNIDLLMQRCIELAEHGKGNVSPNPMVGSLVYSNGFILGEGYHEIFGGPHAEVNAINGCSDDDLQKSILFVSLEPCTHHGKTPPCSDLIVKKGIPSVYIAAADPNPTVAGSGVRKLVNAGIKVYLGNKEMEAIHLNRRFFCYHTRKRPYIILKWAESKDGFIGQAMETIWISDSFAKVLTHKWRASEDAIIIGRLTFEQDKPALTTRLWKGKDPKRIVIDPELSSNYYDGFLKNAWIATSRQTPLPSFQFDPGKNILTQIMDSLFKKEIQSIIVEGGSKTISEFLEIGLWDEARVFKSQDMLHTGIKAPKLPFLPSSYYEICKDILTVTYNERDK